eukprot:TRINITY_DN5461_c2_g1_i1.p1 TRINITY_DN5461_c2_g1~~TRINITY_DN5461_c2_g1_i1.p1  ORF type:complete len:617 (+),score=162.65 TRINITY_DN5461_c2_g1_i1:72-1853(+)
MLSPAFNDADSSADGGAAHPAGDCAGCRLAAARFCGVGAALLYALRGGSPIVAAVIPVLAAAAAAHIAAVRRSTWLPAGPCSGVAWAPFAVQPFSRCDYASPLWTGLLPEDRPTVFSGGGAGRAPAAAQTDIRVDELSALQRRLGQFTGAPRCPSGDGSTDDSSWLKLVLQSPVLEPRPVIVLPGSDAGSPDELARLQALVDRQAGEIKRLRAAPKEQDPATPPLKDRPGHGAALRCVTDFSTNLSSCDSSTPRARIRKRPRAHDQSGFPAGKGPVFGELQLDMSAEARGRRRRRLAAARLRCQEWASQSGMLNDAEKRILVNGLLATGQRLVLDAAARGDAAPFMYIAQADPGMRMLRRIQDRQRRNALHLAAAGGHIRVLHVCFEPPPQLVERARRAQRAEHGGDSASPGAAARAAAELRLWQLPAGELDTLLLTPTARGLTLLHSAVLSGKLAVVEWLVERIQTLGKRSGSPGLLMRCLAAGRGPIEQVSRWRPPSPGGRSRGRSTITERFTPGLAPTAADFAGTHRFTHIKGYLDALWWRLRRQPLVAATVAAALFAVLASVGRHPAGQPREVAPSSGKTELQVVPLRQ